VVFASSSSAMAAPGANLGSYSSGKRVRITMIGGRCFLGPFSALSLRPAPGIMPTPAAADLYMRFID
jgi:hypothetical protein